MINADNLILPQRYIPFDLGAKVDTKVKEKIQNYFISKGIAICKIPLFLSAVSKDILFKVKLNETLRLYIYSFGMGVFVLDDEPYPLTENFATGYCEYRKSAHKEILDNNHRVSEELSNIMCDLRRIVEKNSKNIRISASETWEHNGLSYVMTISYIVSEAIKSVEYANFTEEEKKNLQIMLQPSLAHQEDTLTISDISSNENKFDIYNFSINGMTEPINWAKVDDCGVYISWAAVLIYSNSFNNKYAEILECLEVDLQAMWLYIYAQYINLKKTTEKREKVKTIALKREKFHIQKKYNEFKSFDDSSIAVYVSNIRNELIRTSSVDEEMSSYIEYLEHYIDEAETMLTEKQHKYSIMNEILLFIIAFLQIAPMIYKFLTGGYVNLELWPMIILVIIMFTGMILILRKD